MSRFGDCVVNDVVTKNEEIFKLLDRVLVLRGALRRIADNYDGCLCDHSTPECCSEVGLFCPHCVAAIALKADHA